MAKYVITAPDGEEYEVTAPEGASQEEVLAYVQANYKPKQAAAKPSEKPITSSFLMGVKDPISGGAQLLPRGLEFLTSAGGLAPNVVSQFFGSEAQRVDEMVRREQEAYRQQRKATGEEGFDVGRLAGNIINPASLVGGPGTVPFTRAVTSGMIAGSLQPVEVPKEGTFAQEKAKQVTGGGVGGLVGTAAVKGAGAVLNPLTTKAEQTMRELGVQLTPGQMLGGQAKDIESFAANLPLVGSNIANAKERALFSFNKGVINKTLNKIGQSLPEDVVGRDAVAYVQDTVNSAYDDVLSRIKYKLDFQTYSGMLKTTKLPPSSLDRVRVKDELNTRVFSRFTQNQPIDGDIYKTIESDLTQRIVQLNRGTVGDQDVAEALRESLKALREGMQKQNPKEAPQLRRINSVYRDLTIMENAAAKTGTQNGVFTPKQYQAAVKEGDVTKRKRQFAAGRARGQDISEAAVDILEGSPSYNLEGRLTYNIMGGAGLLSNAAVAAPLAITAPVLYSETGLKAMQTLMRNRPEIARKVGERLTRQATREGSITGANVLEAYNQAIRAESPEE